jgi:catechol 2,3-dioxygenase-like lactoylglutathione lyase family enzyme
MNSYLNHVQLNIDFENLRFYKDLMEFLGWKIIFEDKTIIGYDSGRSGSIWFLPKTSDNQNNYDGAGVNHVGIGVDSIDPVDGIADFLHKIGIEPLFGTPKYRPEFSGDDKIYYQIMFETPDRILFEIVCTGPKPKK